MQGRSGGKSSTQGHRWWVAVVGGADHERVLVIAIPVLRVDLWRVAVATVGHVRRKGQLAQEPCLEISLSRLHLHQAIRQHPNLCVCSPVVAACRQWLCRVRTDPRQKLSARTVGVATALSLVHRTMRHSLG